MSASFRVGVTTILITIVGFAAAQQYPSSPSPSSLVAAQVIFRHGARTIEGPSYPTDPYGDEEFWPNGFNQLTCLGMVQSYSLGQFLQHRYSSFINTTTYIRKEVEIRSSDTDRTIQSAGGVLAGLYSANEVVVEDCDTIPWTNVPIHGIPFEVDNMIRQESSCPRYEELLKEVQGPLVEDFVAKNMDIFKKLLENTGVEGGDFEFEEVKKYYDALIIEDYFNLTLPTWAHEVLESTGLMELGIAFFKSQSYTEELKRLRVGPLFTQVLHNFETTMQGSGQGLEEGRLLYLFSGHDHTIAGFLNGLELYSGKTLPSFSTAIIVELHNEEDKLVVKLYYKRGHDDESVVEALNIAKCPSPCAYSDFVRLLTPYRIEYSTWSEECYMASGEWSTTVVIAWSIVISSVIGIAVALFLCIYTALRKHKAKARYERYR